MNGFFSYFVISFATLQNQSKSLILQNCERSELRNNLQNVSKKVITWKDDSCRVCCHNENEWNYEPFQVCHFDISSCCSLLAFSRQATNFQQPKEPVFFSKRGRQSTQWEFIMSWFFTLFSELKCMTQNGLHACMYYQPWEKPFFQRKIISAKKWFLIQTQ